MRVWDKIEDAVAQAKRQGLAPRAVRLSEADAQTLAGEVREAYPSRASDWGRLAEERHGVTVERGGDKRSAVLADTEFPLDG